MINTIGSSGLDIDINTENGDEICGLAGSFNEVAHRLKLSNKELRSEKEYLKKLHYSTGDAVFTVTLPEKVIEFANEAVEEIFGYTAAQCIGCGFDFLYPDEALVVLCSNRLKNALEQGASVVRTELLLKRKSGEVFSAEATTTFMPEDGDVKRLICIIRDITERKEAEQVLQKAYDNLEEKVANRTQELAQTNKELNLEVSERKQVERALRESAASLEQTQEFSLVMTAYMGLDGRWLKVPPTLCALLGYRMDEIVTIPYNSTSDKWSSPIY